MSDILFDRISIVKGVGDKKKDLFRKVNIKRVLDAFYFKPSKIEIYKFCEVISELKESPNVVIKLEKIKKKIDRNVQIFESIWNNINIQLVFFNKASSFKIKSSGYIIGKYELIGGVYKFVQPDFLENINSDFKDFYKSIYNFPKGLFNSDLKKILNLNTNVNEWIPKEYIKKFNLKNWRNALLSMHKNGFDVRLAFDEAMFLYGFILKSDSTSERSPDVNYESVLNRCGIKLTGSQEKVIGEIISDLQREKPMVRLLHGDVGSGKTIVAMISMLGFLSKQVVILAPTTLLAEQHYKFSKKVLDSSVSIKMVVSGFSKKENLKGVNLIIGTHALIEDHVDLSDAKYIIIDEQHKFGVQQRSKLLEKGKTTPHLLIMSATPIPRTLERAFSGMVDISKITEMPFDKKITTHTIHAKNIDILASKIKQAIDSGLSGYWICPAIEENELMESIESKAKYLKKLIGEKLGVLHGKIKQDEKNKILNDFNDKKYSLLLATTAIETGIDVSHARFIVIENSERFGLAQLHQMRGRVGRNNHDSYCFLIYSSKSYKVINRINILKDNLDGFKIAESDLKNRGSGEFYGNMQSGVSFKMFDYLDPLEHQDIIKAAKNINYEGLENYNDLLKIMKYIKSNIS